PRACRSAIRTRHCSATRSPRPVSTRNGKASSVPRRGRSWRNIRASWPERRGAGARDGIGLSLNATATHASGSGKADDGTHAGEAMTIAVRRFPRIDNALGWITEVPAAILVVAEIVILFAGVVSRYVFNQPLTWSDELASILFLWLAMLG